MENLIKVGEYIRTNKGNIGKIIEIRLGFNKDTRLYQDIYILDNDMSNCYKVGGEDEC